MKHLILAASAAAATLAVATPATAQRYQPYGYQPYQPYQQPYQQYDVYDQYANGGYGRNMLIIRPYAQQFEQRIRAGVQRGMFNRREAARMTADLHDHLRLEQQYSSQGITRSEAQVLRQRLQYFQWALGNAERTGSYQQPRNPYGY